MDFVESVSNYHNNSIPTIETGTVTLVAVNNIANVNCSGSDEKVRVVKNMPLNQGDIVLIARGEGKAWIIGKLSDSFDYPNTGTVGTVTGGSNTIPVTSVIGGKNFVTNMPFLSSYSPVNGDTVQLYWRRDGTGGFVFGKLGTVAAAAPVAPPPADGAAPPGAPPPPPISGTNYFNAFQSGSFRNGKWRTDTGNVVQYDWGGYGINNGAWFYGSTPKDFLAGATCLGLRIKIKRLSGGVWGPQTVHFYLHSSNNQPGGNVTYTQGPADGSIDIGQVAEFALPASWGQELINTGGGIGIQNSPYVVLAGTNTMSDSGVLAIDWYR